MIWNTLRSNYSLQPMNMSYNNNNRMCIYKIKEETTFLSSLLLRRFSSATNSITSLRLWTSRSIFKQFSCASLISLVRPGRERGWGGLCNIDKDVNLVSSVSSKGIQRMANNNDFSKGMSSPGVAVAGIEGAGVLLRRRWADERAEVPS